MATALDFLLVGTPGWEVVARVRSLPARDMGPLREALPWIEEADEVVEGPGGSAVVTATHLARLGRSVAVLGALGDDEPGRRVARWLALRGVVLPCPLSEGRATKRTAVLVHRDSGQVAFFAEVPRRMAPPPRIEDLAPDVRGPGTWVHLDHLSPLAEAVVQGPLAGASLDLHDPPRRAPSLARLRRLLPRLDLVQIRRSALEGLAPWLEDPQRTSLPGPNPANPAAGPCPGLPAGPRPECSSLEDLARALARHGPLVVVTEGHRGARWFHADGSSGSIPPSPVPRLVDPTGAGDAFAAVLIDGLSQGLPPSRTGARAAQAAARACTLLGPWGQSPISTP